jgi:hypothetical protein
MNQSLPATPAPQPQISDVEAWIQAHGQSMLICPQLPGQPRITRETCRRRLGLAREIQARNSNESLFDGGGPVGIGACLECPRAAEVDRANAR